MKEKLLGLDPANYQSHALHRGERVWRETNCYVDLWIEVLHAYGFDPCASLGFCVAADFEGDQWLFFKQPTAELALLYGVTVQELNLWRDLLGHVSAQLARGRLVLVEVDAFYLPDTAGVSYQSAHTKTTIAIESLELSERALGYFHNAGYFTLRGADFEGLLGLRDKPVLVPYTEFARIEPERALRGPQLVEAARTLLKTHVARMPRSNPVRGLYASFERELPWLGKQPQQTFHDYAFATLRQCGACYELAASHLRWLEEQGTQELSPAIEDFDALASQAKLVQFKLARALVLKKPVEFAPMFEAMERAWESAHACLARWAE